MHLRNACAQKINAHTRYAGRLGGRAGVCDAENIFFCWCKRTRALFFVGANLWPSFFRSKILWSGRHIIWTHFIVGANLWAAHKNGCKFTVHLLHRVCSLIELVLRKKRKTRQKMRYNVGKRSEPEPEKNTASAQLKHYTLLTRFTTSP